MDLCSAWIPKGPSLRCARHLLRCHHCASSHHQRSLGNVHLISQDALSRHRRSRPSHLRGQLHQAGVQAHYLCR